MNGEPVRLHAPLSREEVEPLKNGDVARLYGMLYTARDAAHAQIAETIEKGDPLPFDPEGQCTSRDWPPRVPGTL